MPITDLAVKEGDLVAATQGRGFWILDDLSPLHQLSDEVAEAPFHLFPPAAGLASARRPLVPHAALPGANPPAGAVVDFLLNDVPEETEVALEFADAAGEVIRRFEGEVDFEKDEEGGEAGGDQGDGARGSERREGR